MRRRARRAGIVGARTTVTIPCAADEASFGPTTVRVTVERGSEDACPSEAAFLGGVRAALAAAPAGEPPPTAHFEITLRKTDAGAEAVLASQLEGSEASFERSVRGTSCRQAAEAIAFAVVVSINPLAPPVDLSAADVPAPAPPPPSPPPLPKSAPPTAPGAHEEGAAKLRLGGGVVLPYELRRPGGAIEFWALRARAAANADDAIDQKRALEMLDDILSRIPEERRVVFVLFEIEEIGMPEIANRLGIPVGTVASRLRKAREELDHAIERIRKAQNRSGGRR